MNDKGVTIRSKVSVATADKILHLNDRVSIIRSEVFVATADKILHRRYASWRYEAPLRLAGIPRSASAMLAQRV